MRMTLVLAVVATCLSAPVFAGSHTGSGDPRAGEREFSKCKACHSITASNGATVVQGGRTGPNLYGVIGRTIGSADGFRYGDSLVALGQTGAVWNEDLFIAYVQDPTGFLKAQLNDASARSKMAFKLRRGMDDVYAYLVAVGP